MHYSAVSTLIILLPPSNHIVGRWRPHLQNPLWSWRPPSHHPFNQTSVDAVRAFHFDHQHPYSRTVLIHSLHVSNQSEHTQHLNTDLILSENTKKCTVKNLTDSVLLLNLTTGFNPHSKINDMRHVSKLMVFGFGRPVLLCQGRMPRAQGMNVSGQDASAHVRYECGAFRQPKFEWCEIDAKFASLKLGITQMRFRITH